MSRLVDSVWASTTLGAFLCIHCAGAHRKLGVQVSRVKSVQLDTWSDEDLQAMRGGNPRVNEVYAKYLPKWVELDPTYLLLPDSSHIAREQFARRKYEDRQFMKVPNQDLPSESAGEEKGNDAPELPEDFPTPANGISELTPVLAPSENKSGGVSSQDQMHSTNPIKPGSVVEVTKRFLNYFMVIGRGALAPNQSSKSLIGTVSSVQHTV